MKITLNGKLKEINNAENIEGFVSSLFAKCEGIIVELNEEMINRSQWKDHMLKDGDRIELIQFVGGG
jgi:sulfur carrier protein